MTLQVGQTVQEAVETAVETALLDRSFDMRANVNTLVALTGVILYWRGVWNLFDNWLGEAGAQGSDKDAGGQGSAGRRLPGGAAACAAARRLAPPRRRRPCPAGTENFDANLGSLLIGLSVMLLFRVFKLPLAEFW